MSDPVRSHRDRTSPPLPAGPTTSFLRRLAGQLLDAKNAPEQSASDAAAEITQRRIDRAHAPVSSRSVSDSGSAGSLGAGSTSKTESPGVGPAAAPSPSFSRREE